MILPVTLHEGNFKLHDTLLIKTHCEETFSINIKSVKFMMIDSKPFLTKNRMISWQYKLFVEIKENYGLYNL